MDLNNVTFSKKDSGAVNYVRARMAIDDELPSRAARRAAKLAVIEYLQGHMVSSTNTDPLKHVPRTVVFPDSTKAKF